MKKVKKYICGEYCTLFIEPLVLYRTGDWQSFPRYRHFGGILDCDGNSCFLIEKKRGLHMVSGAFVDILSRCVSIAPFRGHRGDFTVCRSSFCMGDTQFSAYCDCAVSSQEGGEHRGKKRIRFSVPGKYALCISFGDFSDRTISSLFFRRADGRPELYAVTIPVVYPASCHAAYVSWQKAPGCIVLLLAQRCSASGENGIVSLEWFQRIAGGRYFRRCGESRTDYHYDARVGIWDNGICTIGRFQWNPVIPKRRDAGRGG